MVKHLDAPKTPYTALEYIDGDTAFMYLDTEFHGPQRNRNVSQQAVETYAAAMARGEWLATGESIKFSTDGVLIDGQHRLWAITKLPKGTTIPLMVTRDVPPEAFRVLDTGRKRTVTDALVIAGETNTKRLGAALQWLWMAENGKLGLAGDGATTRPSHGQRLDLLKIHPGIRDSVSVITTFSPNMRRILPVGVTIWLHYEFHRRDPAACERYFEGLRTGLGLEPNDPVYLMREILVANAATKRKLPLVDLSARMVKAWNYMLIGHQPKQLHWKETESFPAICDDELDARQRSTEALRRYASRSQAVKRGA